MNKIKIKKQHFLQSFHPIIRFKKTAQRVVNLANQNRRFTALLLLTIFLTLVIILGTLIPSQQTFEGSLDLNSLSFTSQTTQPFLENIDSIQEIYINYPQKALPLTLTGKFSDIDPKLANINKITLKPLPDQGSFWRILGKNNVSLLRIKELKLTPETQIKNLEYDRQNKSLSIEEIIPNQKQPLALTLNTSSDHLFTVKFQGYEIANFPDTKTFSWQPDNEIKLKIDQEIKLELRFNKTPANDLFWGKLAVEKVKLINKFIINQQDFGCSNCSYKESAIAGGTVRLADRNYTLSSGQFLTFKPEDSIRYLLGLRLATETTATLKTNENQTVAINEAFQGFKVDISGKTKQIEIGLNENLPVAKLQARLLEAWLPRDAVIALIAFLSSFVATLIGWLWELINSEETTEDNNRNP